jgi:hypothetical protein
MGFVSVRAYDADVFIPAFKGLNQADILMNPDLRFSAEAENIETPNGVLQPQASCEQSIGNFTERVETLASFHRRWYTGNGSKDWYVCCSGGKFYQRQAGTKTDWFEMELPSGVSAYQSSEWSWVTYEINPENSTDTVDVLLMSNAKDGMIMVIPPDRPSTWGDWKAQNWTYMANMTWMEANTNKWHIVPVPTAGKLFGVIERYGERIWGGDIAGEPDMLMYSAPYDPTDWSINSEIPEDGAGDILQPSWDGDQFFALRKFGDHLLAFKKNRIWRVIGVSPGEYQFQEQFGGGTEYFRTIAVDNERVMMCCNDGLNVYDGMSTSPYARESIEQLWKTVNKSALDHCCAALYKNRYYLAFPIGDSTVNNALLVWNFDEGTVLYYKNIYIEALMPTEDALFMTTSTAPGKIYQMNYDSWETGKTIGKPVKWVTPWIDFGRKEIVKGGFELYFLPEVQNEKVTLTVSIQTEKKTKSKNYTVYPLNVTNKNPTIWRFLETESYEHVRLNSWGDLAGKTDEIVRLFKHKKLHFSGAGRRFRVIIEERLGVTAPWRIVGGLQMVVETDPD